MRFYTHYPLPITHYQNTMLETSKDIWWLVFAFITLWVGVFVGWSIFYLTMILRDMKKITGNLRKKLDFIDQILNIFKDKAEKTASYLPLLMDGAGKAIKYFSEKKSNNSDKPKNNKRKAKKGKK